MPQWRSNSVNQNEEPDEYLSIGRRGLARINPWVSHGLLRNSLLGKLPMNRLFSTASRKISREGQLQEAGLFLVTRVAKPGSDPLPRPVAPGPSRPPTPPKPRL